ncbi:hypothetical protein BV20DRAFT_418470 [Pilatotrama ljubarskyi]|nr:hypothetical protein BV20DRAFT_418470 [Pilatotrama ljubarskyi]
MASSSRQEQDIRAAGPPFDNSAADTVLQSSDGVQFHVHSIIVAEASEVFAGMFTIPLPPLQPGVDSSSSSSDPDVSADGRPVARLEEDSRTLDSLLRLCYPVPDPQLGDPAEVQRVLAAAMKYQMEEATALMHNALSALLPGRALEVWAAACSLRLDPDADDAAFEMCAGPDPVVLPARAPPLLEEVTAGEYFRLSKYLARSGQVDDGFCFWRADPARDTVADPMRERWARREYKTVEFQERPFGDIVCRSSDGKELLSHKAVLATVSPVLRERILALDASQTAPSDSQAPSSQVEGSSARPVLEFDEPHHVLSAVLELCYPVRRSRWHDLALPLHDVCAFACAARKYEMDFVLQLIDAVFSQEHYPDPLRAFLLASRAGLTEYARTAERLVLRRERTPLEYGWYPEMETVPASAYHELCMKYADLRDSGGRLLSLKRKRPRTLAAGEEL